jgi:hypothetical protein
MSPVDGAIGYPLAPVVKLLAFRLGSLLGVWRDVIDDVEGDTALPTSNPSASELRFAAEKMGR